MSHDTWFEAINDITKGYWQMPVIRGKSQWDILEFLDVFSSKDFEPHALELRAKNHIISNK